MTGTATGPELVGQLLDAHGAALVLYARQWCAAPEDAVQDALVSLLAQQRPPRKLVAWLYRSVRNRAISLARQEARRKRRERAAYAENPWFDAGEAALDGQVVVRAVEELPGDLREVVVARVWGGLTFEDLGIVIGASTSAAHRRYEAALNQLRERLSVTWEKT